VNKKIISFLVVTLMISICFSSLNVFASKIKVDKSGNLGSNDFFSLNTDFEEDNLKWIYDSGNDVNSVAVSSDGEYAVVSGENGVFMFDTDSNIPLWTYSNIGEINSAAISLDGDYIIAGGENGLYFFEKNNGLKWSNIECGTINSVAISSDGEDIVAGGSNGVYLFEKQSNEYIWLYNSNNNAPNNPGKPIGCSSGDVGDYYTFTTDTTDPENEDISYFFDWGDGSESGWTDYISSGEKITDGHIWYTEGSYDIRVRAKDEHGFTSGWSESLSVSMPKTKNKLLSFSKLLNLLKNRLFSILNKYFFINKENHEPESNLNDISNLNNCIEKVIISSNGEHIVVMNNNRKIIKFSKDSKIPRWTFNGECNSYDMSSDGNHIAVGGNFYSYLINGGDGKIIKKFEAPDMTMFNIESVSIDDSGDFFVAGSRYTDGIIIFYRDQELQWFVSGLEVRIEPEISLSSDGNYIVLGGDENVYCYEIDNDDPLWKQPINDRINSISISSDGSYILAGGDDDLAYLNFNYDETDELLIEDNTDPDSIVNKIPSVYAIVHDPNGDSSYSQIKEFTSNEIGYSASLSVGRNVYTEAAGSYFGQGAEHSEDVTITVTGTNSMTVSYTVSQSVSSQTSNEKDKIGPGHGDVYWIEEWEIPYKIFKKQFYFNNKLMAEKPLFRFGIIRSHSMLRCSNWIEINGANEWGADWTQRLLDLNIGHDNVLNGEEEARTKYVGNMDFETGIPYTYDKSISTYSTSSLSFNFLISKTTAIDLGFLYEDVGVSGKVAITMNYDFGASMTASHSSGKSIGFELFDASSSDPNDGSDEVSLYFYEDKIFGTYLFITDEDNSYTSNPHEYWTQESG